MSAFLLAPSPPLALPEIPFATWENGFTEDQLAAIRTYGDGLALGPATIAGDNADDAIRKCETAWIELNPETSFIYETLGWVSRNLNGQFFDFDIWGFSEHLQYTVYGTEGDHYDWHLDRGEGINGSPRKLSLVIQLSDPDEYEGGDLELMHSNTPTPVKKQKGLVVAFPSFMLHRVTPVTKGVRRSLVVWLTGPRFR